MASALDVAEGTVYRVKRRYADEGLDGVLHDRIQANRFRKLDDKAEAHLIALACSDAPDRRDRWTLSASGGLTDHWTLSASGGLADHWTLSASGGLADHWTLSASGGLADHWTLSASGGLADQMVELGLVESLSYETVRLKLKKRPQALAEAVRRWRMHPRGRRRVRGGHGGRAGPLLSFFRIFSPVNRENFQGL